MKCKNKQPFKLQLQKIVMIDVNWKRKYKQGAIFIKVAKYLENKNVENIAK